MQRSPSTSDVFRDPMSIRGSHSLLSKSGSCFDLLTLDDSSVLALTEDCNQVIDRSAAKLGISNSVADCQTSTDCSEDGSWVSDSSSWTSVSSEPLSARSWCPLSSDVLHVRNGAWFAGLEPLRTEDLVPAIVGGDTDRCHYDDGLCRKGRKHVICVLDINNEAPPSTASKPDNYFQHGRLYSFHLKKHQDRHAQLALNKYDVSSASAAPVAKSDSLPVNYACSAALETTHHQSAFLQGYFRILEQDGSPCYTFFVNNTESMFFARGYKPVRSSNIETSEWMYRFHLRRIASKAKFPWKRWSTKEVLTNSNLVGRMKVSSYALKCASETQFVLFGNKVQNISPAINVPPRDADGSNLMTPSQNLQCGLKAWLTDLDDVGSLSQRSVGAPFIIHTSNDDQSGSSSQSAGLRHRRGVSRIGCRSALENFDRDQDERCVSPVELAAIVINTSAPQAYLTNAPEHSEVRAAGWGVKFLYARRGIGLDLKFVEKTGKMPPCSDDLKSSENTEEKSVLSSGDDLGNQINLQFGICENSIRKEEEAVVAALRKHSSNKVRVEVTMVLPAGMHGLPEDGSQGPTPLVEQWRRGGACDCGGWDEGCGVVVLKSEPMMVNMPTAPIALTNYDRMSWISRVRSLNVRTQGRDQKQVVVLEVVEGGLFSLRFDRAHVSPLQAFAAAVAISHVQARQR